MSKAEVVLWVNLRALHVHGYKFRRQHPIGPYIADFAIHVGKLVIEVDGATHGTASEVEHDRKRDAYLRSKGWRVLRVPNAAVYEDVDHVVATILSQLPPPSRRFRL
jgi:very-short-patch-repair endonuclease